VNPDRFGGTKYAPPWEKAIGVPFAGAMCGAAAMSKKACKNNLFS
jgi:hypothetical protein